MLSIDPVLKSSNSQLSNQLQGFDLASLAAIQAAMQQQMLFGAGQGTGTGSGSGSSGKGSNSSSSNSNSNSLNTMNQLNAMAQAMMNPAAMMYNYQALAMMMGAGGVTGSTSSTTNSSTSSKSNGSQSAASQMMDFTRQAAAVEQLQRQYLLDMMPGGLGSWPGAGSGTGTGSSSSKK